MSSMSFGSAIVGKGATLRIGANAATPFVDGAQTELTMAGEATLSLPEGTAVTVSRAFVGGVKMPAGTYTGAAGAGTGRIVLSQIEGAGTLTVLRGGGLILFYR